MNFESDSETENVFQVQQSLGQDHTSNPTLSSLCSPISLSMSLLPPSALVKSAKDSGLQRHHTQTVSSNYSTNEKISRDDLPQHVLLIHGPCERLGGRSVDAVRFFHSLKSGITENPSVSSLEIIQAQATDPKMSHTSPHQPDNCENHVRWADSVKAQPQSGNDDGGAHHTTSQSQHMRVGHHGEKMRSDAYLRQALTSPYNYRGQQMFVASPSRNRPDGVPLGFSPVSHKGSPHHDRRERALAGGSPRQYHSGASRCSGEPVFKTPHRTAPNEERERHPSQSYMQNTSGGFSPVSSASSGSSGGHPRPHFNPFEIGHNCLHFPVFSPGVFQGHGTPASAGNGSFRWDLEHIAELRPVHIDEKDIKRQFSTKSTDTDNELEEKVQHAVDYYFTHHMVAPSPWGEDLPPHVLPTTPVYAKGYMSTPNETQGSIQKELTRNRKTKDTSCQTTLTLPVDFDIYKVLDEYMTYQDTEEGSAENMSTSSLRRKLFFNADCSSMLSPVKSGKQSLDYVSEALLSPQPFTPSKKTTPEWERSSPLNTPSSIQFSSSPIRGPFCSDWEYRRYSFSELGGLASPELSPIIQKQTEKSKLVMRRLSSLGSNHADEHLDDVDMAFSHGVKKQLQMEIHDGCTPPLSPVCLPNPNLSPIAYSGTGEPFLSLDMSLTSRSRTLRAEISPFSSGKNEPEEKSYTSGSSQLPLPFASVAAGATATVFMEIDPFAVCDNLDTQGQLVSPRDTSMTDMGDGEGVSSLDTLQHPSSLSNQDTGYQTASGSGSLHTTQLDGGLQHVSNDTGTPSSHLDSSLYSASAKTKPVLKVAVAGKQVCEKEPGVYFMVPDTSNDASQNKVWAVRCGNKGGQHANDTGTSEKMAMQESSISQFSQPDCSAVHSHTNLTEQFLGMPFQGEHSFESTRLETSMQSGVNAADYESQPPPAWTQQKAMAPLTPPKPPKSAKDPTFTVTEVSKSALSGENASEDRLRDGRKPLRKIARQRSLVRSRDSTTDQDVRFFVQGKSFSRQDADSMQRDPEHLEKDVSSVLHKYLDSHNTKFDASHSDTVGESKNAHSARNLTDDSMVEQATQHLTAFTDLSTTEAGTSVGKNAVNVLEDLTYTAFVKTTLPSSLTSNGVVGKIVKEIEARNAGGEENTPTLASEVAKEILRRAEADLNRYQSRRPTKPRQ